MELGNDVVKVLYNENEVKQFILSSARQMLGIVGSILGPRSSAQNI